MPMVAKPASRKIFCREVDAKKSGFVHDTFLPARVVPDFNRDRPVWRGARRGGPRAPPRPPPPHPADLATRHAALPAPDRSAHRPPRDPDGAVAPPAAGAPGR